MTKTERYMTVLGLIAAVAFPQLARAEKKPESFKKGIKDMDLTQILEQDSQKSGNKNSGAKNTANQEETTKNKDKSPQESSDEQISSSSPVPTNGQFFIFFGGAGLLAILAWFIKRYRQQFGSDSAIAMDHLQTMQIGHKHQLSIIRVGSQTMLLGITKEDVKMLCELQAETLQPESNAATQQNSNPLSSWQEIMDKAKAEATGQASSEQSVNQPGPYDGYQRRTNNQPAGANMPNGSTAEDMLESRNNGRESQSIRESLQQLKQKGGGLS